VIQQVLLGFLQVLHVFLLVFEILAKLLTIERQHCLLTEPYFLIIFKGTFKYLILDWLE
jgi:hypothetical protein